MLMRSDAIIMLRETTLKRRTTSVSPSTIRGTPWKEASAARAAAGTYAMLTASSTAAARCASLCSLAGQSCDNAI